MKFLTFFLLVSGSQGVNVSSSHPLKYVSFYFVIFIGFVCAHIYTRAYHRTRVKIQRLFRKQLTGVGSLLPLCCFQGSPQAPGPGRQRLTHGVLSLAWLHHFFFTL